MGNSVTSADQPVTLLQRLRFLLLLILPAAIVIELSPAFIVLPAISIVLLSVENKFDIKAIVGRVSNPGYFLTLIFVVHAIWFLPFIIQTGSTRYVEKTLPFLLFPIMISSTPLSMGRLRIVFKIFIWAFVISYLLSLVAAVYHFLYSVPRWGRATDFFFHEEFTKGLFNIHPTYYGILGCLATLFTYSAFKGISRIAMVGFLTVMIFAINAKITLVIQILLILAFIVNSFSKGFSARRLVVVAISVVVMVFVMRVIGSIYDYPHRKLFANLEDSWTRSFAPDISDGDGGIVMRMAIWRSAWEVIQEHYVLGVGLGFEQQYLVEKYTQHGYSYLAGDAFNSHNEFFSYAIGMGMIGCILQGIIYFRFLREAYIHKARIYFVFVTIFVCAALTESIFNRLLGISTFAFFNALLVLKVVNHDK